MMRYMLALYLAVATLSVGTGLRVADAQTSSCSDPICWRIENRFRLFADKRDFHLHEAAWNATAADGHSVLAMERFLNGRADSPHDGWAAAAVDRLCFDETSNAPRRKCLRDGSDEDYFGPKSFAVVLDAQPALDAATTCEWTATPPFQDAAGRSVPKVQGCRAVQARVARGETTVTLTTRNVAGQTATMTAAIAPKDILVVGMGDSFTSGDGNPDKPVKLEKSGDLGMCYRRFGMLNSRQDSRLYLPARRVTGLNMDCEAEQTSVNEPAWKATRAQWLYAPCHRSLYGHQLRAALALALEASHRTVTYVPLGCTGGEIVAGLLGPQKSREVLLLNGTNAASTVGPQLPNLRAQLAPTHAKPDLVFLAIGGNDVGFSDLVADLIITGGPERGLTSSFRKTPAQARAKLPQLVANFRTMRKDLKAILGGTLSNVVYVPYGNPLMSAAATTCPTTLRGFDGHPAFSMRAAATKATSMFVEKNLVPLLEALALCMRDASRDGKCADAGTDTMRFAGSHRPSFEDHGVCAVGGTAEPEPAFDAACFRNGGTFKTAADRLPLAQPFAHCDRAPADWRPYASRKRWTRTPNDSFLTAMSYADSLPAIIRADSINDATWGFSSVVYGGAAHPTAEGHAAMADAALIEARQVLPPP